jgi:hypothetical protein
MPAPSLTEIGKLSSLGLLRHYQRNQNWYVQQGKGLVAAVRFAVSATKTTSGSAHVLSQDEVAQMLRIWLTVNQQWQLLLKSKPNLPVVQYDLITDAMARYVAYDAYLPIIA